MFSMYLNIGFAAYFLAMVFYTAGLFFRNRVLPALARGAMIVGIFSLTIYLVIRWIAAQQPPLSNMFESLVLFSSAIGVVFIFVDLKYKTKSISVLVVLISLVALGYAGLFDKDITPLLPALKSNWLTIHVLTCFIGYAAFTVAFVSSLVYLIERCGNMMLEEISYKMIAFGFLFLTLGIISGAVWANVTWGSYWNWDPKETWSLITWFVYAIYLHLRLRKSWQGGGTAWISIVGFSAMLFTYFGVNYFMSGLHSYL